MCLTALGSVRRECSRDITIQDLHHSKLTSFGEDVEGFSLYIC